MSAADADGETFNPWTVVHLVFTHLAEQGLHPVLGDRGDPLGPARELLLALGIQPAAEGNREVLRRMRDHLAEIRAIFDDELAPAAEPPGGDAAAPDRDLHHTGPAV
jgi:hypothetical protein